MKNRFCIFRLLPVYIGIVALIAAYGCKKQDDLCKQYVVEGGLAYPGKASNVKARSGRESVEISWLNIDPMVTSAKIFWNNYEDSVVVNIPAETDMVVQVIELPEGEYSFFIFTYDAKGNVSVPVEVFGRSIGDKYINSLRSRDITGIKTTGGRNLTIEWDKAGESPYLNLVYTATGNVEKTIQVKASEQVTTISDYLFGNSFRYSTVYKPDPQADEFTVSKVVSGMSFMIPKSAGRVINYSSQFPDIPSMVASKVYDGDVNTFWLSDFVGPHFIVIDLGAETNIARLCIWPSDATFSVHMQSRIRFEVSSDNASWVSLGDFDLDKTLKPHEYHLSADNVRYIKWSALDDPGGADLATFGELDVYVSLGD